MTPPLVNLLCLPCAGASATMYLRWRRVLPSWIRVVPVELPGRGSRLAEAPLADFVTLVAQLCDEQSHHLEAPHAFFGHSMGALLAHGMAKLAQRHGAPLPQRLFASASAAPSKRDNTRFAGALDDATLIADLREQGGTPDEVLENAELMEMTLRVLRADYQVCASYTHRKSTALPVPIDAFGGQHDAIPAECLAAWGHESSAGFSLNWFDGGHFYLRGHEAPLLDALAHGLLRGLQRQGSFPPAAQPFEHPASIA